MDCSPPRSSVHGVVPVRILEWVTILFSRGSSRPRDQTWVFHITGRCFTLWATREALGKVMLKILQTRLQHYMKQELPDGQAGFRKGRETRDQIANIWWIIEKAREFHENICFVNYTKAFDWVAHNKLWKVLRDSYTRPPYLPPEIPVCRSRNNSYKQTWNNRPVQNWERRISKLYVVTLRI